MFSLFSLYSFILARFWN